MSKQFLSAGLLITALLLLAAHQTHARKHEHYGEGFSVDQVENSEFEAVSAKMQDIEDTEAKKRGKLLHDQQQRQLEQFQAQLDQETAQLKTAIAKQQQLEQQLQQQQGLRAARVKTSNADLKAEPYNQSKTVRVLSQGDELTVLVETPSWYRVQMATGEQGWVYRLMLEITQ